MQSHKEKLVYSEIDFTLMRGRSRSFWERRADHKALVSTPHPKQRTCMQDEELTRRWAEILTRKRDFPNKQNDRLLPKHVWDVSSLPYKCPSVGLPNSTFVSLMFSLVPPGDFLRTWVCVDPYSSPTAAKVNGPRRNSLGSYRSVASQCRRADVQNHGAGKTAGPWDLHVLALFNSLLSVDIWGAHSLAYYKTI